MNITQDIVTDLLPAYLSGEASRDTQALVEDFMNGNPQFAAVVHAARRGLSGVPAAASWSSWRGTSPRAVRRLGSRRGRTTRSAATPRW